MKAVILAGGGGTRLQPITHEIPKPLIPVKKKPILNHTLDFLNKNGISEVYIIISTEHKEDFENWIKHWKKSFPIIPKIFIEEKPKGTFGALREVKKKLKNEDFILFNGDSLIDIDLTKIISYHESLKNLATICIMHSNTFGDYFVPEIGKDGKVIDVPRKKVDSSEDFIFCGLYILSSKIFDYDKLEMESLSTENDILPVLIKEGKLFGYKFEVGRFFDCGTLESWTRAILMW
jgi:NDP-sugar pyrophosphorylase family protein